MGNKKLIEVALPLEAINAASAREKSIRHGHPSTLHLWWARRPLAAARAVIWGSLVDDPSAHPEKFPTEKDQDNERQRLFKILEDLIIWENSDNKTVLDKAKQEILQSTNGNPPALLDPFAGGGAIPFEAQRLGLTAIAHDLNPVAVLINKSMIEIPSRFKNTSPVNKEARKLSGQHTWLNTEGIASDFRYYSSLYKKLAYDELGQDYPEIDVHGNKYTPIAWIWTRTIKCPNPACDCEVPLVRSFDLSKKKGKESYIKSYYEGKEVNFQVIHGRNPGIKGTVSRKGAVCIKCGAPISFDYIREQCTSNGYRPKMMAIVGEAKGGRVYCDASLDQINAARVEKPSEYPDAELPYNPRNFQTPNYGMDHFSDLFSNRQLLSLSTFSALITEVQKKIEIDAVAAGMDNDHIPYDEGGNGALAYSQALSVYLSFIVSKLADRGSTISSWDVSREGLRNTFGRQAIPMTWDYAEANPFSHSTGCFDNCSEWIYECILNFPAGNKGVAEQQNAQSPYNETNVMISTDPPYYNNIVYADLADFFYIWLRNSLGKMIPSLFRTMLVPKSEELVATPYRFKGSEQEAKTFFEDGMSLSCKQMRKSASDDIPVTIYYAYKQSETEVDVDGKRVASTGWETMLNAIIKSGFYITGTWPIRTEMANRSVASEANALASSIVLVCRKRPDDRKQITRRNFIMLLRNELRSALKKLQESNIAPVDLAQSAIGPGIGVFSRYQRVLEADGSEMSVRSALQIINEEIDLYFNEQVGDLDSASRFCVDLYMQAAYNDIRYGEAEVLANAKGTSIPMMASHGVLYAKAGTVHLIERNELPEKIDHDEANIWLLTQQLTRAMTTGGVENCAQIIAPMYGSNAERAKELAYRLYTIAEQKNWAQEAYAYNALVVAWPDIQSRAATLKAVVPKQMSLFDFGINENK